MNIGGKDDLDGGVGCFRQDASAGAGGCADGDAQEERQTPEVDGERSHAGWQVAFKIGAKVTLRMVVAGYVLVN